MAAGILAPIAGWIAMQRGRNPAIWFALGGITGPIAVAILLLAPPGRCPACDDPVAGWPAVCPTCGARIARLDLSGRGREPARRPLRPAPITAITVHASDPVSHPPVLTPVPGPERSHGFERGPSARAAADTEEVLATGIYVSGNAGMEIGALYAIARVDDRIRVFGPVDTGQLVVRLERPLADTDVSALDDRIVISSRSGRSSTSIVMRAVGGKRSGDLEDALAPPPHRHQASGTGR